MKDVYLSSPVQREAERKTRKTGVEINEKNLKTPQIFRGTA